MNKQCPFCNLETNSRQNVVLTNEHCLFLMEPQEVLIGSGIIIPKAHRRTVFDLTPSEWQATCSLLKKAKLYFDSEFNPGGYNVGWNAGEVAGQKIFHAHLHLIPRYADEPHAGKGIRYWIKQQENKRSNV